MYLELTITNQSGVINMMEEISLRQRNSLNQQDEEPTPVGVLHERPAELSCFNSFKIFFWNSEEHKLMGRTAWSWVKILVFYCIFYLALCGLFAACWGVFRKLTLSDEPYRQLHDSLIRPGLSFRPNSPLVDSGESTLNIHYYKESKNQNNDNDVFIKQLNNFLKKYTQAPNPETKFVNCDYAGSHGSINRTEYSCIFDASNAFSDCTPQKRPDFGYSSDKKPSPCIFLKLNKIFGWEPEFYNANDLPSDMPDDLKTYIENVAENEPSKLKTVWVSCKEKGDADVKNIGEISYVSERGFPGYFFPFSKADTYWSPLVALKLDELTVDKPIDVECRLWAKNIKYDHKNGVGLIRFQIHVHSINN